MILDLFTQNLHFLDCVLKIKSTPATWMDNYFQNILSFGNTNGFLYKYFNYRHEKSLKLIPAPFVSAESIHTSHSLFWTSSYKFLSQIIIFPGWLRQHLPWKPSELIPDFYTFLDLKGGRRGVKMASFTNINWLHNLIWHRVCFINERN